MKRSWPVFSFVLLCVASLSVPGLGQDGPAADGIVAQSPVSQAPVKEERAQPALVPDDPDVPAAMQQLMRAAMQRYVEGSNLLKMGDTAAGRAAFDGAVNMLLQSQWDITATPALNRFFQDLIHNIQQDESRYLTFPGPTEEKPESAVVDELDNLDLFPIAVDPSLEDVVEADLANTKYDIPVTLNERVLKSLNYWLNRGRKFFTEGLVRSGRYKDMIQRIFREESIPLDVMYLAQVESLFKTNALSRAQAKGIWQFGKWTAIRYGLKVNPYVDERSDPEKSTRAAARYLNDLYEMFKDWNLVLAAYNWGEGNVQKLINRSGINDFWDLMELRRNFPRETKDHVPLIMASMILAKNPAKYGLPEELDEPLSYDRVTVSKAIDLRAAAAVLNTSVEHLKQLNPALRGMSTPPDYPDFELKVPVGSDPDSTARLAELPAVKFKPPVEYASTHRVRRGETLSRIAARYRVSLAELKHVNHITGSRVKAGTVLTVPRLAARARPAASSKRNVTRTASNRPGSKRIKSSIKPASNRASVSKKSPSKSSPKIVRASAGQKNLSRPAAKSVKLAGAASKSSAAATKSVVIEKKVSAAAAKSR